LARQGSKHADRAISGGSAEAKEQGTGRPHALFCLKVMACECGFYTPPQCVDFFKGLTNNK
jgi:hypothetical protein